MKTQKRRDFIKNAALMTAAATMMPAYLLAAPGKPYALNPDAILDLHCHPSLKMYLLKKKMWKRHHWRSPGDNDLHMQEDVHSFLAGNVRGMMATHYLPESGVETEWSTAKSLWNILKHDAYIGGQIEKENGQNFYQINEMIDDLENQIKIANRKQRKIKFVIAKTYADFIAALNDPAGNVIPMAHAIEDAHSLGRNIPISTAKMNDPAFEKYTMTGVDDKNNSKLYLERLEKLRKRGVCMITLGHFFKNDFVCPVDGISPNDKAFPGMAWEYTPDKDRPLSPIGCAVVTRMLTDGMIVDLTHVCPQARRDVFDLNRDLNRSRTVPRPLVFTHVGAQAIFDYYDQGHYPYYKYYDVSDEEIDLICECNGVIGVIPENFWLAGADTHLKKDFPPAQFRRGIGYMIETMKNINSKTWTKDYDNVGIGTDFDGLADNPKDLYLNSQLSDLIAAMQQDEEFTADHISKITSGNALRLLKDGWGNN